MNTFHFYKQFLFFVLAFFSISIGLSQTRNDSIKILSLKFSFESDSIAFDGKSFLAMDKIEASDQLESNFDDWEKQLFEEKRRQGYIFNERSGAFELPDNGTIPTKIKKRLLVEKPVYALFKKIESPIATDSLNKITLAWGYSADKMSADQPVDTLLIHNLKKALTEANESLLRDNLPPIKSLYVKSTLNGVHSEQSNHYRGTAIDISRVNGVPMYKTRRSSSLFSLFKGFLRNNPSLLKEKEVSFLNSKKYKIDLLLLHIRVEALQIALERLERRRENFGPIFNTKYNRSADKAYFEYKLKRKHDDHIHFAVR